MNKKTYDKIKVKLKGGVFNIASGYSWKEREGLDVNLILTPKIGSCMLGVSSGYHQPGEGFEPHVHPISEELLIVFRVKGEIYLENKWIPVEEGDIVYAPPGIKHGTRNPKNNKEIFITIGCASPPQLDLYQRANYNLLEDEEND